jgi:hypothetical protein
VIKTVTTGQSVRAVVFAVLVWLTVVGGSCGGCTYYFFGYPKSVAKRAMASLRPGQKLPEALAEDSGFTHELRLNKMGRMFFFRSSKDPSGPGCGTAIIHAKGTDGKLMPAGEWKEENIVEFKNLSAFLSSKPSALAPCDKISTDFMPALFYRCTVEIQYDSELKIQRFELTKCWD